MGPPLSKYPEAPKDQSLSEIKDCPKCGAKMWLSEKKKAILVVSSDFGKEVLLACYDCITEMAQENPSFFKGSETVDL
jgi:hypothetical protein